MRILVPSIAAALFAVACSACGSSGPANPDAPIADARPPDAGDAGVCPGLLFFTGAYEDWDSTDASFHGIAFATWQVEGSTSSNETDTSAPNGRVLLCIPAAARSSIKVTPMSGDAHLPGHFIADPAVFSDGSIFDVRGITAARAATQFGSYDAGKGDLEVEQLGTPAVLTFSGGTVGSIFTSPDGMTWTAGAAAQKYVMFANIDINGTPHISGAMTGNGDVPMLAGEITLTTVVGGP